MIEDVRLLLEEADKEADHLAADSVSDAMGRYHQKQAQLIRRLVAVIRRNHAG